MDNKNLTVVATSLAVVLTCFLLFILLFNNLLIGKISSRVIEDLKRSYTPGPYDPGFDPDKVDPKLFRDEN